MGSVEADDERQIAVADNLQLQRLDNLQLQRLAHSSSSYTAVSCPGDIGGPSEQACTIPTLGHRTSAAQYAVDVTSSIILPGANDNPCSSVQNTLQFVSYALQCTNKCRGI